MNELVFYALLPVSALITAVSQILLKLSANREHRGVVFEYLNPCVILAYLLYGGVLALNVWIYTRVDYRYGVVIQALALVAVMLLSRVILKEPVTKRHVVGNALIICGVILFTLF